MIILPPMLLQHHRCRAIVHADNYAYARRRHDNVFFF